MGMQCGVATFLASAGLVSPHRVPLRGIPAPTLTVIHRIEQCQPHCVPVPSSSVGARGAAETLYTSVPIYITALRARLQKGMQCGVATFLASVRLVSPHRVPLREIPD